MEELIKKHKLTKHISNFLVLSFFGLVFSIFIYSQVEDNLKGFFLLIFEGFFVSSLISFILSIFFTLEVNNLIDEDLKLKLSLNNLKAKKIGYNSFSLEKNNENIGDFEIDYNMPPSYQIEINFSEKKIIYK